MFDIRSAFGSFVQTPLGPLKSGMPDSVEMPAPVSATMRRDPETRWRAASSRSVIHVSVSPFCSRLERAQERDQIGFLLRREDETESSFIETYRLQQRPGRAVVEVRRARRQASKDRALELADVIELPVDERLAEIGGRDAFGCRQVRVGIFAADPDLRQIRDVE